MPNPQNKNIHTTHTSPHPPQTQTSQRQPSEPSNTSPKTNALHQRGYGVRGGGVEPAQPFRRRHRRSLLARPTLRHLDPRDPPERPADRASSLRRTSAVPWRASALVRAFLARPRSLLPRRQAVAAEHGCVANRLALLWLKQGVVPVWCLERAAIWADVLLWGVGW
eukprot:793497-Rhodomonas_salina.3